MHARRAGAGAARLRTAPPCAAPRARYMPRRAPCPARVCTSLSGPRARLQVRVAVTLVAPGALPRSMYKQSLVAVRPASEPSA